MNKFLVIYEINDGYEWDSSKEIVAAEKETINNEDAKQLLRTWLNIRIVSIQKL